MSGLQVRRTLYESPLVSVGHFLARPDTPGCGPVEQQSVNVLVLPLAGVYAKHDGPRQHVVTTPNHAAFIAAHRPYRLSYPGGIGDEALTLRFSGWDAFDSSTHASHALLPPSAMLARSLLWRALRSGPCDPLEVEEQSTGLLHAVLRLSRKTPSRSTRCAGKVERVKEAIAVRPEHKWTLRDLAQVAAVSPFHLSHLFRREVGASVHGYVVRARLAKALGAVLDSGSELSAIAFESGFASHSHFTARFRALFGLTPQALRRGAQRRQAAELRKIVTAEPAAAV